MDEQVKDESTAIIVYVACGVTGQVLFMQSLQLLQPVVAVMAMHTGLVLLTCVFRILTMKHLVISAAIFKLKAAILLIEFGAIPGLSVAKMDQFSDLFPLSMFWT